MFNGTRVLVLSCLAIALSPGCTRSKAGPAAAREPAARMVKTEPVRQEALRRTVEIVGTLAAEDEVTISSQVDGIVRAVLADLGDPVKSGQTLVEIDREKLQYTLDEQKASDEKGAEKVRDSAEC